ncbi:hypothetical protein QQ008_07415 [Fulvivirgaceae bacterium BMA10]|uniref:CARD domain-containing protein n=1 Tax=Splendidivirga corallicola TaxID=3051826 RepID=A0ABT8KN98_9BACT|nr:hypothetical protein [Fulvivirgaceae bacterium BMA10]
MKTTQFDEFLKINKIKVIELPEPIREKMEIHKDMHDQLGDTVEDDKKTLQKKLDDLEDEIYEDLLNEFDDQLTNNEVIQEKPKPEKKKEAKKEKDKNEEILDIIYEDGKIDNLSKSYLKSKGLDVDFSQWEISIGKYLLYRKSVFHIRFRLAKK